MNKSNIDLSTLPKEDLLNLKISDLPLAIENSYLSDCINELKTELTAKDISFIPDFYLSDEWLTPDGEPIIGIPFFLADPTLIKLEKEMMYEAEGEGKTWCLKLLRHETGHALNYAYKLYKRKKWKQTFGSFNKEYAETYKFRPYSKNFVRHLENYYAQYHPDEDFSETFAVWLTPESNWQNHYKDWGALKKLTYVDSLMQEIKNSPPIMPKGHKYWQQSTLRLTLKNYYKKKKDYHAENFPDFHDANLKEIFLLTQPLNKIAYSLNAAQLIKKYRSFFRENISQWTGEKKYIINQLITKLIDRTKELNLQTIDPEPIAVLKIATYITTLMMNYMYTGKLKGMHAKKQ